ncbi:unnamed protein product [Lathyrus sativus]|nr:unnamed protein product [Lathyrus sativus]
MFVIEAETMALKEAIQESVVLQLGSVVFECDSQKVVQAIQSSYKGNSEFYVILYSIKVLLAVNPNFELKFIRRQVNMVAHFIIMAANSCPRRNLFNLAPRCIEQFLINEMR